MSLPSEQHTVEVNAEVYDLAISTGYITAEEARNKKLMDRALSAMLLDAAKNSAI
jgi:hypothetical protein